MYVNLDVVDYEANVNDLDVYIYNADGSSYDFSYTENSNTANETINLPANGTYLIYVYPYEGSSKYHLTLGQRFDAAIAPSRLDFDYIKNEIIGYQSFTKDFS